MCAAVVCKLLGCGCCVWCGTHTNYRSGGCWCLLRLPHLFADSSDIVMTLLIVWVSEVAFPSTKHPRPVVAANGGGLFVGGGLSLSRKPQVKGESLG